MGDYSTTEDQKTRWGGILENPYISKLQRHGLDGFKVRNLSRILKEFRFENILDVCCGLGEYSTMNKGHYVGVDNSFERVAFASQRYKHCHCQFIHGDAMNLPFKDNSFDAVLHAGSAHHFSDEAFANFFREMQRVSRKYVIVADIVKTSDQGWLSKYIYNLDRGTQMRTVDELKELLERETEYKNVVYKSHKTFPGLYTHAVFISDR